MDASAAFSNVQINRANSSAAAGVTFPASVASPSNITSGTITTVTNLTNAPTSGDLTATMKTSVAAALLDTTTSGHTTAGTVGAAIYDADKRGSRVVARGTVTTAATTTSTPTSAFSPTCMRTSFSL